MAGIGEASAIIAVAQAGISLSMVIIAYVGDVKDAPKSISRIGNEIKSTSGRLEEIAEIIRDNPKTRLLLDTAVGDATRCSSECELILAQVGNLLVKGGWNRDSTGLSKNEIDTSVVASLKWPFLKTRLDTPRVELQSIKADLILLFNVAMARKSSTPLTNEYARKIPLLTKKKEEAARRAEEARHKARESNHDEGTRTRSPPAPSRRAPQIAEEDPELSQQFWEFELQRAREQEDRKIQECAALLQAENDSRQRSEEDRRREIARKAVEDYKLQQEELKAKTVAREKQLSDELFAIGLGPEQVASVLAVPSLKVDDIRSNAISRRKSIESQHTSLSEVARRPKPQRKRRSGFAIKFLPWRGSHGSKSYDSESNSVESNSEGNGIYHYNRGTDDEDSIELWLVDVFSRQHTELAPSERWLSQKLDRIEKSNDVWHRFAQLQPIWRVAIQDFLNVRNKAQTPDHAWKLTHIGLPRRMTKMGFFGHNHQGQLVRLIISRRKTENQGINSVVVVKSREERTSQSTVRARTYLPRQLVSTSAIRDCSYNYEERFDVPPENTVSELKDVTDKTHIMIPEALTLKQVNTLAGLTKSYMESGREPWAAQPLFTYTIIENEIPDYDQERVYDHGPGEAPGRLTPGPRYLENHQQGRTEDRTSQSPRDLKTKIEGSIDYLKQHRSVIGDSLDPEDRVWLFEIDAMIAALGQRLAKPDSQIANINDYKHDSDFRLAPFQSQSKPYRGPPIRSSEEERLYREDDFQSRNLRPASIERRNMDRRPLSRRPSDRAKHVRQRLNASLAERGLQTVPEDDLGPYEFIEETRKLGRDLPSPPPSPQWACESHRRRSADSGGADKRSYEPTRDEEFRERVNKTFGQAGYDEESIEKILKKGGKGKGHGHGKEIKIKDLTRPTYIKVHREHVSPETLDEYSLPWELDERDSNYIVIKQWIPEADQIILFDHTKKLRERKMITDSTVELRRERDNLLLVRKKSPTPPLAPPTLSKSLDSRGKPWHKYEKFSSRPPIPFSSSRFATQSRAKAPKSVDSGDDDEEDHDFSESAKDDSGDDADLIAKTLSRYTTFKIDEDATAGAKSSAPPAEDAPVSPTTSRTRSSTPPRYPSTLEEMKSSLEKMQIKQSRAEEEGDLATTTDLRYYAIPEMERRIKEKEDESRTRAEEAEDEIASASNASKRTPNAIRLSRIQRRGILDDSPTEEQPNRNGERTSRLLKKRESTDDLRSEDLADPSIPPAGSANDVANHAAHTTGERNNEPDNNSNERLDRQHPRITEYIVPRLNRSPSESGSESRPLRRADTQLYEADSEGSGGDERTFERRDRWRRPTVEDEIIVEEEED